MTDINSGTIDRLKEWRDKVKNIFQPIQESHIEERLLEQSKHNFQNQPQQNKVCHLLDMLNNYQDGSKYSANIISMFTDRVQEIKTYQLGTGNPVTYREQFMNALTATNPTPTNSTNIDKKSSGGII